MYQDCDLIRYLWYIILPDRPDSLPLMHPALPTDNDKEPQHAHYTPFPAPYLYKIRQVSCTSQCNAGVVRHADNPWLEQHPARSQFLWAIGGVNGDSERWRCPLWIWMMNTGVRMVQIRQGMKVIGMCHPLVPQAIPIFRSRAYTTALRVEWCRCLARAMQYVEEVELLPQEVHRVLAFHEWNGDRWNNHALHEPSTLSQPPATVMSPEKT